MEYVNPASLIFKHTNDENVIPKIFMRSVFSNHDLHKMT